MAFPDISPQQVEIAQNTPMITLKALNGREERLASEIPYFSVFATFENVSAAERRQIIGHHASVGGSLTAFDFPLPEDIKDNSVEFTGTITANGAANAGDSSIAVTTSADGAILKAGDYIRFDGHDKLYQVKADVTASSSSATITIFPALLSAVANAEGVFHTDLNINVRYLNDNIGYTVDPNLFGDFTIGFKENI